MSETKKKLTVRRETLRDLSAPQLSAVTGGGIIPVPKPALRATPLRASVGVQCGLSQLL